MIRNNNLIKFFSYFVYLNLINFFCHFLPYSRPIISADDLGYYFRNKFWLKNFLEAPDRPIRYIWQDFQNQFIGLDNELALLFLIISTSILIFSIFILNFILLKDLKTSFIISFIFIIISINSEIYSSSTFIHINIVTSLYIYSTIFFIQSVNKKNYFYFLISIVAYTIAILWYEIGFFIPIIYLYYLLFLEKRNSSIFKFIAPFFILIILYFFYRLNIFNLDIFNSSHGHALKISFKGLFYGIYDIFNLFLGRSFLRSIVYGIYYFFNLSIIWIIFYFIINLLIIYLIFRLIKNVKKINLSNYSLFFFILFILSLLPNILNNSIGGRHTIIGCIFISFIIFVFIQHIKHKSYNIMIYLFIFIFLIVSQGNNWIQIDSLKIQKNVFSYLDENKDRLESYKYILIDRKSLANNIPHTFFDQEYNQLRTYYGAQCLEDWGIKSMIGHILKENPNNTKLLVANEIINKSLNDNELTILVTNGDAYRNIKNVDKKLPLNKTMIITYKDIYNKLD